MKIKKGNKCGPGNIIACIQLFTSTFNKTAEMPGTNYNAEMSRPPYKCVYLESDIASYHYAPCEGTNAASRPQKNKRKERKQARSLYFGTFL